MDYVKSAGTFVESNVDYVLANAYMMAFVKITLILYAAQLAPRAPEYMQSLFQNTFVKMFAVFLIAYIAEKDLQLAILMAIIYVFGMNLLSGRGMLESYADFSAEYKPHGDSTLIEPHSMIYPGCHDVTMDDLHKVFEGDLSKMQKTVQFSFQQLLSQMINEDAKQKLTKIAYAAGLPYNMSFDKPETAPYIATLLVNYGFEIKNGCAPPQ
jgi:hypothetical protein